ncbi:MAG: DUF2577 family protein [Oscillospiraceae bacterium]|nr:DUF2577 family protein [Oscillospiraceae bacterium]
MKDGSDAYSEMLDIFGAEGARKAQTGALQLYVGTVLGLDPLEIEVNETTQSAADGNLWINPQLTASAQISTPATLGGISGTLTLDGERQTITEGSLAGTLSMELPSQALAVGDLVILLTRDQQSFFVLCKEVKL